MLKEIRGGWVRKYQVLLVFLLRQLRTTASLRNGNGVVWNLAISEANLCRGSTKHSFYKAFLKNFCVIYRERPVPESLFQNILQLHKKTLAQVVSFEFWNFLKTYFCKTPSGHCFCSLKNHSGSMQNLPLECWYNNSKTSVKKFVLVKFQTCIRNWPF